MINEILLHEKVIMHSAEGSEHFKVHIYKVTWMHRLHTGFIKQFLIQPRAETSYIVALILRC